MSDHPSSPPPLDAVDELLLPILAQADSAWEAGVAELCSVHPERADELRRRFAVLRFSGFASLTRSPQDFPDRLGGYVLRERLGSGGMGVVYLAHDDGLRRLVALKIVRPEHLYFPGTRERFRREIEAVAKLSHPGIVSIHTVGEEKGLPYFAMEVLRGATLETVVAELAGRPPGELTGTDLAAVVARHAGVDTSDCRDPLFTGGWIEVCTRLALRVAEALAHAHSREVIHRDVKPSNVFVTPEGRVVLLDFGLAFAQDSDRLTRSGAQLGSLPYMAPEQVRGEPPGPGADLYSLGVTLYELLALRQPYLAATSEETRRRILAGESEPLHVGNPAVSWELETVCSCARELEAKRRYTRAEDFARDLHNLLERRPILARPASRRLLALRFTQRHPALVTGAVLGLLLTVGTPTGIALGIAAQRDRALAAEAEQERRTYYANVTAANAALLGNDAKEARLRLEQCPKTPRGWEWEHLRRALDSSLARLEGHTGAVTAVAIDDRERLVATGDRGGELRLWDAQTGAMLGSLPSGSAAISELAFDAGTGLLLAADATGTVRTLDAERRVVLATRAPDPARLRVLLGRGDGPPIVLAGAFDIEELEPRTLIPARRVRLQAVGAPPDSVVAHAGGTLCAASFGCLAIWNLSSGALRARTADSFPNGVAVLAVSSDGTLVAGCDTTGRTAVVRAADGRIVHVLEARGQPAVALAFDTANRVLVSATRDRTLSTWDLRSGRLVARLHGHDEAVTSLAIRGGRYLLASGSTDRTVRLWSALQSGATRTLHGHFGRVTRLGVSGDGKTLYSACDDGALRSWDPSRGVPKRSLNHFPHWVNALAVPSSGPTIWASFHNHLVASDAGSLARWSSLTSVPQWITDLVAFPDGRHVLVCGAGGTALVIDSLGQEPERKLAIPAEDVACGAVSRDGRSAWIATRGGSLTSCWAADGSRKATLVASGPTIRALATSETGDVLFAAEGSWLRARESVTGTVLWERSCTMPALAVALVAGGSRLATGHGDGTLILWDRARGWPVLTLQPGTSAIVDIACDPGGDWLATGHADGSIVLLRSAAPLGQDAGLLGGELTRACAMHLHRELRERFGIKCLVLGELAAQRGVAPEVTTLMRELEALCEVGSWARVCMLHDSVVCRGLSKAELEQTMASLQDAVNESRSEGRTSAYAEAGLALAVYRSGQWAKALELAERQLAGGPAVIVNGSGVPYGTRALAAHRLGRAEVAAAAYAEQARIVRSQSDPRPEELALLQEVEEVLGIGR